MTNWPGNRQFKTPHPENLPVNELHPLVLGMAAVNYAVDTDSAPRRYMFGGHMSQEVLTTGDPYTPLEYKERAITTGMEYQLGKATFREEVPEDCFVYAVIPRYAKSLDGVNHNPETFVIYVSHDSKRAGLIRLYDYSRNHPDFGFAYRATESMAKIRPGCALNRGEKLLVTPRLTQDEGYIQGVPANVAFIPHFGTAEDSFTYSDEYLRKLGFKLYQLRTFQYGTNEYLVNHLGDDENYKAWPDIGEVIPASGLLVCSRKYGSEFDAVTDQNQRNLKNPIYPHDSPVYVCGPGGRVVDVKVFHDTSEAGKIHPKQDKQALKYLNAISVCYRRLLDTYKNIKRDYPGIHFTPELTTLLQDAMLQVDPAFSKVRKTHRRAPCDVWRVQILVEYDIIPNVGFKTTDFHGGKGTTGYILPAEHMPVDALGNRADYCAEGESMFNRMNNGRPHEAYMSAGLRDEKTRMLMKLGIDHKTMYSRAAMKRMLLAKPVELIDELWQKVMLIYDQTNKDLVDLFADTYESAIEHLSYVLTEGFKIVWKVDNPTEYDVALAACREHFPPQTGPVSYVDIKGRRVTTENNVIIGRIQTMLLEKISMLDLAAVASGPTQADGIPAQMGHFTKYQHPVRQQTTRCTGETEARVSHATAGPAFIMETQDRNNNPHTHAHIVQQILTADKPSNIDLLVDRSVHPFGLSRPLQKVNADLMACGIGVEYVKAVPQWVNDLQEGRLDIEAYKNPV